MNDERSVVHCSCPKGSCGKSVDETGERKAVRGQEQSEYGGIAGRELFRVNAGMMVHVLFACRLCTRDWNN